MKFKVFKIIARKGAARLLASFCGLLCLMTSAVVALEQYTAHGGPVKHLTLSPDGSLMVSKCSMKRGIYIKMKVLDPHPRHPKNQIKKPSKEKAPVKS